MENNNEVGTGMMLNQIPSIDPLNPVDFELTELGEIAKPYDEVYVKFNNKWQKTDFREAENFAKAYWRGYKYSIPTDLEPIEVN
jgi:hypothetical protein